MQIQPTKFDMETFVRKGVIEAIVPELVGIPLQVSKSELLSYDAIITNTHISQVIITYIDFNEIICDTNYSLSALPNWRWELLVAVEAQRQALIHISQRVIKHVRKLIPVQNIPPSLSEIDKVCEDLRKEDSRKLVHRREQFNVLETRLTRCLFNLTTETTALGPHFYRTFAVTNLAPHPISYFYHPSAKNILRVMSVVNSVLLSQDLERIMHSFTNALHTFDSLSIYNYLKFMSMNFMSKGTAILATYVKRYGVGGVMGAISKLPIQQRVTATVVLADLLMVRENPFDACNVVATIPDELVRKMSFDKIIGFITKNPFSYFTACMARPLDPAKVILLCAMANGFILGRFDIDAFNAFNALPASPEKKSLMLPLVNLLISKRSFENARQIVGEADFPPEHFDHYLAIVYANDTENPKGSLSTGKIPDQKAEDLTPVPSATSKLAAMLSNIQKGTIQNDVAKVKQFIQQRSCDHALRVYNSLPEGPEKKSVLIPLLDLLISVKDLDNAQMLMESGDLSGEQQHKYLAMISGSHTTKMYSTASAGEEAIGRDWELVSPSATPIDRDHKQSQELPKSAQQGEMVDITNIKFRAEIRNDIELTAEMYANTRTLEDAVTFTLSISDSEIKKLFIAFYCEILRDNGDHANSKLFSEILLGA